jgi:hypothetical protein
LFNELTCDATSSFLLCYSGLKNPFTLMSYVTPVMAITTAILSIVMDPWHDFRASHFFDSWAHILKSSLLMLLGGSLAFFMVWSGTHSWELKHLLHCILRYIFSCTKECLQDFISNKNLFWSLPYYSLHHII